MLAVFAQLGVGAAARRLGVLTREADASLVRLVVNVLIPCYFFDRLVGAKSLDDARNVWLPPVLGFASVALGIGAALVVAKTLGPRIGLVTARQRGTFALTCGMYNYGYVTLPLAAALYGGGTVAVCGVFNVGVEVALWTIGVLALTGSVGKSWWRGVVNGPLVGIVIAELVNALGLAPRVPDVIATAVKALGDCALPMGIVLSGATIVDALPAWRPRLGVRVFAAATVLRVGLLPLVFLAVALVVPTVELRQVLVLQAAMPAAVFPLVLVRLHDGDTDVALSVVLGTQAVALGTIPLWVAAGQTIVL